MTTEQPVEIVAIVDRSGSMAHISKDAIGAFNTFLKEQQEQPGQAVLTVTLFDDKYETYCNAAPIKFIAPLTSSTFVPRGSTALYDAIGKSLAALLARNPERAIVTILTDGEENSSKEYSRESAKALIQACESRGYRIVYLAANQDAFIVGHGLGINPAYTRNYAHTGQGVGDAVLLASSYATDYRNKK